MINLLENNLAEWQNLIKTKTSLMSLYLLTIQRNPVYKSLAFSIQSSGNIVAKFVLHLKDGYNFTTHCYKTL